jgi:HD-GYP domain-containing protein (c-di-GMP phosphodiesterase class II)
VTEWHPRSRALVAAGEMVKRLTHACHARTLYPAGHPQRDAATRSLTSALHELQDACAAEPTLFVSNGMLYLGSVLLARESLSYYRLSLDLEQAGIEALTFGSETSETDLEQLSSIIGDRSPAPPQIGGVAINKVSPAPVDEPEWQTRLGDLRRAYSSTLDVLRQSGARATSGRSLDFEAAHDVVRGLGDEVGRDPGYGLLLTAVQSHDDYTHFHMVNVCVLSIALGRLIGLETEQVVALGVGGLFHDIGKLNVPEEILNSTGKLDEEQWRIIQHHPVAGAGMLFATGAGLYHPAVAIALEHHAAFDRTGYPALSSRQPSLPARLVSVADCFDAVTTRRSYRGAMSRHDALGILIAGASRGFDPRAVRMFAQLVGGHPVGSLVELDSGEVAVVVRPNDADPARPTVLRVLDRTGTPAEVEERDLATTLRDGSHAWTIVGRVDPARYDIDLAQLVLAGQVAQGQPPSGHGLVHEPSPGESVPEGYVDTHAHRHVHTPARGQHPHDPDVAAPFEDS